MADALSLKQAPLGSRPTALVLSGGAAMGAWQAGFMYALERTHGIAFHSVVGTSAGALNGAAYFQGTTDVLKDLWRDTSGRGFLRWAPRLSPPSLFSQKALRRFLESFIDEERCRASRRCWFYTVSADIGNCRIKQAEFSPHPDGPWDSPLLDHVMGSGAVPFLFPPVKIPASNGSPAQVLVDGQMISFAELMPLVGRGARDFVFVNIVDKASKRAPGFSPRGFISALIHQMLEGQIRHSMSPLRLVAREKGLRAFEFNPSQPLKMKIFGFDPRECRWAFDLGLSDAQACLDNPEAFRIL